MLPTGNHCNMTCDVFKLCKALKSQQEQLTRPFFRKKFQKAEKIWIIIDYILDQTVVIEILWKI